jgi:hypothetical protein
VLGKEGKRVNTLYLNTAYLKAKMVSVEATGGGGGEERRVGEGMNPSMKYLIHCKNFCKNHSVPPPNTTTIIIIKNRELISFSNSNERTFALRSLTDSTSTI